MGQDNFNIIFFELDETHCPVQDFLDLLDNKMAAKIYGLMDVLAEAGTALRMPYSEHLGDGIFEYTETNAPRWLSSQCSILPILTNRENAMLIWEQIHDD